MDKNILEQYLEIKGEIRDLHERIDRDQRRLERIKKEGLVSDTVRGTRKDGTIGPIKITGYPLPEVDQVKNMIKKRVLKEEIFHLKQERLNREFLSEADIFQKYIDIAFADITDYMTFGTEEVPVMAMYGPVKIKNPETGEEKQLTKIVNTVRFKDSSEVDGTILSEVKQGKDGASIKLSDRMKALQWLSDHMDMATEEQKAKIAQMKAQTDKLTGNNQEIEDLDDIEGEIYGSSK